MHTDIFGQQTSIGSRQAMSHWNDTMMAFLAHSASTPDHLMKCLSEDPDFALAYAVKGVFYMLLGRRELIETAQEAAQKAEMLAAGGSLTPRELSYVHALRAYLDGRLSDAVEHYEDVLKVYPEDSLAMKLSHAVRFVLGDNHGMRRSVEAVMPHYAPDHPARGYLLGCHAFGLEETGEYGRAAAVAKMGLAQSPDDAWGLHAVAHVFDMTGNARDGIRWLEGREAAWEHCNNFRYHVWWHKALMHLEEGQADVVLALYDTQIRQDKTDDYRDISNATSLLSRLELDGFGVGDRWEELADISENRTEDGCLIFADLHYLLALVGGDRDSAIKTMIGRLHRDAISHSNEVERRMRAPGLTAAAGLEAFGEANYAEAFRNLLAARGDMQSAGGSHAQRDVFERLTIDSGLRAGFLDQAEAILNERKAQRAGKDDNYSSARRELIEEGRVAARACALRVPAE